LDLVLVLSKKQRICQTFAKLWSPLPISKMRLAVILLLSAGALASPVGSPNAQEDDFGDGNGTPANEQYQPCSQAGFFGNSATCCSFDIIGAASLGCKPRKYSDELLSLR
jgi:hypothetical protein